MKILIVGKGIIGTIYGWALTEAGVEVTHLVRPGSQAVPEQTVKLDVLDERKGHKSENQTYYTMSCVDNITPEDGFDWIIVPVNAGQLESVLSMLAPVSGNACFFTMTSNWNGTELIDQYLPRNRYILGYADGGGTIRNGVYWTNLGAEVHLGKVEGTDFNKLDQIKTLFEKADMKPDIQPEMLHWLWVHNASATAFAAGFAYQKEMLKFLKNTPMMRTCIEATRELLSMCEKRGANLKDYPEISFMGWPDWLVIAAMRWLYTTNKSMQRYTAHAASDGSLEETRLNYQLMMKTAKEMNLNTPALKKLGEFVECKKN